MSNIENVYRVTPSDQSPGRGKPYWMFFACEFDTLEDLTAALNDGKLVCGDRLVVERGDVDGVCLVRDYRGTTLAKGGVGVIEESPLVFQEIQSPRLAHSN